MRVTGGALGEVSVLQGGNTAAVLAAAATQDETLGQYLAVAAALYGWDGTDLRRLLLEDATNPNLRAALYEGATQIAQGDTPADGLTQPSSILDVLALPHLFNGSTWDRQRSNPEVTLLASGTRSSDTNTPNQTNYGARGLVVDLRITARTVGASPTITVYITHINPIDGSSVGMHSSGAFDPTTGHHVFLYYPTAGALTQNDARNVNLALPRTWKMTVELTADITDLTYSLSGAYIL